MSTEVGSLQASLTLDLSNFKAGISEATTLASELASQLRATFSGDVGIAQMAAQVREAMEAIKLLRAELSNLQAMQNAQSGSDMFAQMRTHTASLPSEIGAVQSALLGAVTAAQQLSAAMQAVARDAQAAAQAAASIHVTNTGTPMDFSSALAQLQQMSTLVNEMLAALNSIGTVDLNTGEVTGGEQLVQIQNLLGAYQLITKELTEIVRLIREADGATAQWLAKTKQVSSQLGGASTSGKHFNNQVKQANKNLQTTKGYAVSIKGIIGGIVISQAFYSLLNIMEDIVQGSIEFSQNMQDAGVAFEYLMRDAEVSSDAFLNALKDIALVSPLDTTDLTSASRKLMAMGFSAKSTVPALQILTDTAAVFSNGAGDMSNMIDHIALAFGQMIAAGKVSAQELRQLYNAGLPVYELLSDGLGITMEMAKNAGHYNIDSAEAVYAILMQLQERYGGAAQALANTMSGSLEVIRESLQQLLSYAWSDGFDLLTEKLNLVSKYFQALVKITQAYNFGGLFQAIFPQELWNDLRKIASGILQVIDALRILGQIIASVVGGAISMAVRVGGVVLPIIGLVAGTIARIAQAVMTAAPWLKTLFSMLAMLIISVTVAKGVVILAKAIYMLSGAKAAVAAISGLLKAFVGLLAGASPVVIALMAIAAAFLVVVAASERARAAIAAFFGGVGDAVSDLGQGLGLGFSPDDIAMPEFTPPDTSDFSDGLNDMISGMEDLSEAEDDAGDSAKKAKKNIQSFDEVYQIEDEDTSGSGLGEGLENALGALGALGDLDYSNLFDWTGDWATDWANLTAGLGDFASGIGSGIGSITDSLNSFLDALTGHGDLSDALAVCDALSIIFAILGKLKWAGALQVFEGISKIAAAIEDISANGINFDSIMLIIDGLGDIAMGIGLISGNYNFVAIGLLLQGVSEVAQALKNMVVDGINIEGVLDVIEGVGKIAAAVGILQKNYKLAGAGLIFTGLSSVISELASNWDAIRSGDWSGVDKVALMVGALETLGGVLLALKGLRTVTSTVNAAEAAADAATAAQAATQAADSVSGATKGFKMPDWTSIGKTFTIIAGGLALVIASVALLSLIGTENLETSRTNAELIGQSFLDLAPSLGLTLGAATAIGVILQKTPINFTDILAGLAAIDVGLVDMVAMVALLGLIDTATIEQGTTNIKKTAEAFMALEVPLDLLLVKAGVIGAIIVASYGLGALALAAGILAIDATIADMVRLTDAASAWDTKSLQEGAKNIIIAFEALDDIEGPLDRLIAVAGAIGAIVVLSFGLGAFAFAAGLEILNATIETVLYWFKQYATWDMSELAAGAANIEFAFDAFTQFEEPLNRLIDLLDNIGSHTNNIFGIGDYDYDGAFDILSRTMDSLIGWMEAYASWDSTKLQTGSASISLAATAGAAIVNSLTPLMSMLDNIGAHTNNIFGICDYDYEGAFETLSGTMNSLISWMETYSTWETTKIESGGTAISLAGEAGKAVVDTLQPLMDMLDNIGSHTNNLFGLGDYDYDGAFDVLSNVMDSLISWMETYSTWETDKIEAGGTVMGAAGTAGQTVADVLQPILDMLNSIGVHTNNIFGIGDYDYEGAFTILSSTMDSLITWIGSYATWDTEALQAGADVINLTVPTLSSLNDSFTPLLDILNSIGQKTNNIFGIGDYDYEGALSIVTSSLSTIIDALSGFGEMDSSGVANGIKLLEDLEDSMSSLTTVADNLTNLNSGGLPGVGEDLVDFAEGVKEAFTILGEAPYDVVDNIVSALQSLDLSEFTNIGVNMAEALTEGVNGYKPNVTTFTTAVTTGVKTGITNGMSGMTSFLTLTILSPITSWFAQYFTSSKFESYGGYVITGIKDGNKSAMATIATWLILNVNTPYHNWFKQYFDSTKFEVYGKNIVQGMIKGIEDMEPAIQTKVDAICSSIMRQIQSALQIHSPSKFTQWCGEMLMSGMQLGIVENASLAYKAAQNASAELTEALTPSNVGELNLLGDATNTSLDALMSWSTSFVSIIGGTFETIASMFESFNTRLSDTATSLQNMPTNINAQVRPIAAVEQLATVEQQRSATTPGTQDVMRVLASLTEDSMDLLSTRVAERLYEYLAPMFAQMSGEDQDRVLAYVGTLIADDKGLKQLERKLAVIRKSEQSRRE